MVNSAQGVILPTLVAGLDITPASKCESVCFCRSNVYARDTLK